MSSSSDRRQAAQSHVNDLGQQVSEAANNHANAHVANIRNAAASRVQNVADATQAAAAKLDGAAPQAQAMHQVADQIEDIAGQLRTADLGKIANQATQVARANPLVFLTGAAIAGFAVARFLKARDTTPSASQPEKDPWANHPSQGRDRTSVLAEINRGRADV